MRRDLETPSAVPSCGLITQDHDRKRHGGRAPSTKFPLPYIWRRSILFSFTVTGNNGSVTCRSCRVWPVCSSCCCCWHEFHSRVRRRRRWRWRTFVERGSRRMETLARSLGTAVTALTRHSLAEQVGRQAKPARRRRRADGTVRLLGRHRVSRHVGLV